MTFEVKPIDPVLFDQIFTPALVRELDRYTQPFKNWSSHLEKKRWAINEEMNACFLRTPMKDRLDPNMSYSLIWNSGLVIIREIGARTYEIVYSSLMLRSQMEDAERLMRNALRLGGELLQTDLDLNSSFVVPNANFIYGKGE